MGELEDAWKNTFVYALVLPATWTKADTASGSVQNKLSHGVTGSAA